VYRLVRRPVPAAGQPPRLDDAQRQVVSHEGGPLLVLAGPGTGKTTTIVEAVAHRIEDRAIDPERILVLTFSRKAAAELRERITARLHRTTREPLAMTFHSYAYALVRREFVLAGDEPPRLLSAPEQLLEVRRMLRGEATDGAARWPERLRPALATRGFAEEVRDLLLRAAERGLDGRGLRQLGKQHGRDDWMAAASFLDRYAARFDLAPVPAYDYAEIVRIAATLLSRDATRQRERDAFDVVLVDEYQDSDPAQEALLRALAGDGRELIAVGDPDQSIYAFRGADVRALTEFPDRFRTAAGDQAPVIALQTSRRSGPVLLAASRRVARRLPRGPGGTAGHRDLRPAETGPARPPGEVRILVADSSTQEAALVADTLRRAHLADGVPWPAMTVLVRSATAQVPLLRRALTGAGVPVTVAGDELPLADEPGTRPLLMLLRCALKPATLDEQTAAELLSGPLGATDALGLRRLRRALQLVAAQADAAQSPAEGIRDPIAQALLDPRDLTLIPDSVAAPARRIANLLKIARDAIENNGNAEDVLWAIWDASNLAAHWQEASEAGGPAGAAADRDLDAVLALFDKAAHFTDTMPPGAPALFADSLSSQEIAGDTLAERAAREDSVRILTAHRSKGLEWDVVIVAGVQEDTWPDLRLRGSLLGVDELAEAATAADTSHGKDTVLARDAGAALLAAKLLAEERRLFYVAVTRARRLLVVTAAGGEDTDQRPSRFLTELAGAESDEQGIQIDRVAEGGHRWLSMPALVADLRRTAADTTRPMAFRQAAATQLARLAEAGARGANPREWYALTELSDTGPIVAPGQAVRLSPSQVESFTKCGLRWLLEAAVGAGRSDVLRHLGTVIHAAAVLAAAGASERAVADRIDEIWHHLDFGSVWYSGKQRALAEKMVRKFLDWHAANPRELVAVEQALKVRIGQVEITGRVDRLEADDQQRAVVVDLKTGGSAPREEELDRHPQLGVYQLAVLLGAFERFGLAEPGGAELVQVGKAGLTARAKVQRQSALADDPDPSWAKDLVETVAAGMAGPFFEARVHPGCRTCPVASCCPVHPEGEQVTPLPRGIVVVRVLPGPLLDEVLVGDRAEPARCERGQAGGRVAIGDPVGEGLADRRGEGETRAVAATGDPQAGHVGDRSGDEEAVGGHREQAAAMVGDCCLHGERHLVGELAGQLAQHAEVERYVVGAERLGLHTRIEW
jgi:superfamily I DNA/RNA helicase/RecB family exonuclease